MFAVLTYDLQAQIVLTIEWNDLRDYEDGQERLQRLHYLQDRVFVVSPRLRAMLDILGTLEALEGVDMLIETESRSESAHYRRRFLNELKTYKALTNGLLESARSLERRMEGIVTMVSSSSPSTKSRFLDQEANLPSTAQLSAALNLRHQATGVDISGGVLKLTTEIVSDSTTVRVITFVTLLYMPATFIAVRLALSRSYVRITDPHFYRPCSERTYSLIPLRDRTQASEFRLNSGYLSFWPFQSRS